MSLRWSYENTAAGERARQGGEAVAAEIHVLSEALAFYAMAGHFGEITEANAADVFSRIRLWETLLGGPLLRDGDGKPRPITPGDVHDFIGFTVNVTPDKPGTATRKMVLSFIEDWRRQYQVATAKVVTP